MTLFAITDHHWHIFWMICFIPFVRLVDWLVIVLRPALSICSFPIFQLYGDITITSEGLQNLGYARFSGPLSREGSLSCHICCDTGPRFFRSHLKDRPIQPPLSTHKGIWRIYSHQDPHGYHFSRLLRHTRGCGGPILFRILTGPFVRLSFPYWLWRQVIPVYLID
jgi:hypothetical protein